MSAIPQDGWQAGFLQLLPTVETHARIRFRRLPKVHREEKIQEAIAAACINYQLAAAQGKLGTVRPGPLADFACRHVGNGRHVGGKQDAAKDPMSLSCQRRHGITVESFHAPNAGGGTDGWRQVAIADRKASIPDTAAFRIDFDTWLKTLNRRDRRIIAAMVSGERNAAVAGRFGVTPGRVSQLRRKYEAEWKAFQGEVGWDRQVA
jgi:hypothetical protein